MKFNYKLKLLGQNRDQVKYRRHIYRYLSIFYIIIKSYYKVVRTLLQFNTLLILHKMTKLLKNSSFSIPESGKIDFKNIWMQFYCKSKILQVAFVQVIMYKQIKYMVRNIYCKKVEFFAMINYKSGIEQSYQVKTDLLHKIETENRFNEVQFIQKSKGHSLLTYNTNAFILKSDRL